MQVLFRPLNLPRQQRKPSRWNRVKSWRTTSCTMCLVYIRHLLLENCVFMCVRMYNLSIEVAVSSGAVGESGPSAEPAAVWDDDVIYIREEGVSLGQDHGVQAIRACLLHAFNDKLHVHWQLLVGREEYGDTPLHLLGSKSQWQHMVRKHNELEENLAYFWMVRMLFWNCNEACRH